jgi:hypothetical protein
MGISDDDAKDAFLVIPIMIGLVGLWLVLTVATAVVDAFRSHPWLWLLVIAIVMLFVAGLAVASGQPEPAGHSATSHDDEQANSMFRRIRELESQVTNLTSRLDELEGY